MFSVTANCCESSNNVHEIKILWDMTACIFVTTQQSRRRRIPENQNLHDPQSRNIHKANWKQVFEVQCEPGQINEHFISPNV